MAHMPSSFVAFLMDKRAAEILESFFNERKDFFNLFTIFHHETAMINPIIGETLLEFEEKITENLLNVEEVYRSGFRDGFAAAGKIKQL
ncbi:hypothetical protein M5X06_30980 [Paenibacillus alvei]|uniref:Uncharacterized protein n=1 Tax=Paenibacillus alvei TaxID=44250 RepID=A0ABT4H7J7_PAEAL|nr:hypothetical protein [Paenibacillus alvei]MCY9764743.1 hypothetical protein [Paenibacillus alvei]MCY9771200.1 hypothetical protein [Paenibacillus alvei]